MAVRFNPTGSLDIASDPADLPEESASVLTPSKKSVSGAMQRCTNLHLDRAGIASTRRGSAKLNTTAIDTTINKIIEQAGYRYAFAGDEIYRDETSLTSGLTIADWTAILYNSYATTTQAVFALNGTDRKRIEETSVYEWGSESPTVAPTLATGLLTGLTGGYNAKYTWCRKEGTTVVWESNPSPAADAAVSLVDGSLLVSVSLPTDTQINYIRIYRTLLNGAVYYWDQDFAIVWPDTTEYNYIYLFDWEISNISGETDQIFTDTGINIIMFTWEVDSISNIADYDYKTTYKWEKTEYVDNQIDTNTADDSLGSEASWTDHDRPPLGTIVIGPNYGGICFIIKDNNLYYCLPNQPEYWPTTYYIEVSPVQTPLKAGCFLDGGLYVASQTEIYSIQGSGPGTFFPLPMGAQTGSVNKDCFVAVKGYGIFHLGNDGIYQMVGGKDQLISRGQFEPLFRGETRGNIPGINRTYISNCWMIVFHGKLYFAYPGGTSEYPDNMLVMDLATNRTVHHDYPTYFRTAAIDSYNNRLLAGDTSGYVWQWENIDLTDDNGTAIDWQIQTKDFNQLNKYFPRYARYDVDVVSGTANGYVLLDDSSKQTHTITGSRLTKKRLITSCTGDRLSVRLTGSGSVQIYAAEIE